MRVYIMLLIIGLLAYFGAIMPIRNYLCEKNNMTAVWYLQGCVLKELKQDD
jgi:hypothetical protein